MVKLFSQGHKYQYVVSLERAYLCDNSDISFQREPEGNLGVSVDQDQVEVVLVVRVVLYVDLEGGKDESHRGSLPILFLKFHRNKTSLSSQT